MSDDLDFAPEFPAPQRVDEHELVAAYMALHPGWTARSNSPTDGMPGGVWIETLAGEHVAGAPYTAAQADDLALGGALYARTFVAVSVAEFFSALARFTPARPRESAGWEHGTKRYAGVGIGRVSKVPRRARWRWHIGALSGEAKGRGLARLACDDAARGLLTFTAMTRPQPAAPALAPPLPLVRAGGCMPCLEVSVSLAAGGSASCTACRSELRRAPAAPPAHAEPQGDGAALMRALREVEGGGVGLEPSTTGKGSAPSGYGLDEQVRRRALECMRRLHALAPDEQLALFYTFVWCGTSERERWDAGRKAHGPFGGFDEQLGRLLAPDLQTLVGWRVSPTPSLAADAARRIGREARTRGGERYAALPAAEGLAVPPSTWLPALRDEVSRRLARIERARAMGEALAQTAKAEGRNRKERREALQKVGNVGNDGN